jgi:acetyl/propionyl-CoA carboxylase alpha subunit
VDFDGEDFFLEFRQENGATEYTISGTYTESGKASIAAVMPGVFSVLLGSKSFSVAIARRGSGLELWAGGRRHFLELADPRDRSGKADRVSAAGPVEIRAQMPGKVIKVLVERGAAVETGQGIIIVEAMKMQNEMKSPKSGVVGRIQAAEGSTVAAGETLMVIE